MTDRRPQWVYGEGEEPDPRFTLANERTFLAWVRTALAMLAALQVPVRDENGWKLSTTRAAAQVMGALRACAWNASSDAWRPPYPSRSSPPARSVPQRTRSASSQAKKDSCSALSRRFRSWTHIRLR